MEGYSWTETNVPVYYAKIRSITVQYKIQVVYGAGYSWTETNVPVYYAKIRSITVQYNIQVVYGAGYSWTETNVPVYYSKIRSITGPALDNAVEQTKVKYLKLILEGVYIFLKIYLPPLKPSQVC